MKVKRMIEVEEELNIIGATLLSIEEAEKLPMRLRKYRCWWWLRSPGYYPYYAVNVRNNGSIRYIGNYVDYGTDCVRPALLISNLESSNLKIGDCFSFDGKEFEIISDYLAFCKSDIGQCCFRYDYKSYTANDYEFSDVKKFVDNWFRKAKEEE